MNMLLAAPVQLVGEGQYNLNALTQIEITDSYLALDEDVRGVRIMNHFSTAQPGTIWPTFYRGVAAFLLT